MSRLVKSDLSDANTSRAVTNLEKDKEDTESLINVIQDFIDSSKEVLVGDSFDAVRNHMQEYINILQTRIKIADSLLEAVKNANQTMIDYMGSEDILDTERLDFIKQDLSMQESSLASVNAAISSYDPDKTFGSLDSLYSQRSSLEANIQKLKTKIDLIEKLDAKDAATYSTLMSSETELTGFNNTVGGVRTISI